LLAQDSDAPGSAAVRPQVAPELRERLLNLLPAPLPEQAVAQGAAEFYTPETLYQYMDGGADIFVLYELGAMLHQDAKAGNVDVTVDIFDMGADDKAFGIYAAERSPSYDFIALGTEGYRNQGIVNFLQGRYYVKLAGFGEGADAVLEQFAHAISASIGGRSELPALLQKLPQTNRKAHSEQYLLKDPLGHSFLGPAHTPENVLMLLCASGYASVREHRALHLLVSLHTGKMSFYEELVELSWQVRRSFVGDGSIKKIAHSLPIGTPAVGVKLMLVSTDLP
jgi:hypothetical protein